MLSSNSRFLVEELFGIMAPALETSMSRSVLRRIFTSLTWAKQFSGWAWLGFSLAWQKLDPGSSDQLVYDVYAVITLEFSHEYLWYGPNGEKGWVPNYG